MNIIKELEKLTRKYYGYVADLEGSSVEVFDLLSVRDRMQEILNQSTPDKVIPEPLYERIHALDALLFKERETFLIVVGQKELQHARQQKKIPRSHWWWYLDELRIPKENVPKENAQWKQKAMFAT